ncbi:hypothetical protein FRUB_04940 [Fimbriiglobus ruber]|uniref:Uncharacterized protein n=1 Tax=Fimbriiglobus ruber TaxID=1908690 RepID=A0A225DR05_9BACT|nr:hypothetical protein FRUB_04940 [Fimbriiglobus ruber]
MGRQRRDILGLDVIVRPFQPEAAEFSHPLPQLLLEGERRRGGGGAFRGRSSAP